MLRRSFVPILLATVALAPSSVFAEPISASGKDPMKIAQGIERQWVANYDAANASGIAKMFASDGNFVTTSGAILAGPAAIENALATRMKSGWTKETVNVLEAHASGTTMWIMGEYTLIGSGPYEGKEIFGHFLKVLSQDGADWRIRTLIGNATPLGIASPASPR